MIWSAVLPGAALRVLRTAAGRRALHVALLVGGLFVLGLLCGGRAQAADEEPGTPQGALGRVLDVSARARSPLDAGSVQDAEAVSGAGSRALLPDLRPVTEEAARTVEDQVVRPVGDVLETMTEAVVLPDPSGPADPADPAGPAGPADQTDVTEPSDPVDVPDLTEVLDLTEVPGLTGTTDPSDLSGRSRSAVPNPRVEPARTVADASDTADPSDTGGVRAAEDRATEGAGSPARAVGYGPESGDGPAPAVHTRGHRSGTAHPGYAPAHPAPTGDPDGTLGTASGADQGTPRHGETRAVAPQHRLTFRLVPGASERADAAGLRESYRDVPVSPA
ncbi:hypothetical protein [Streptomyces violaceorubidus]|uniref:hypothetical protein n=1 Tax=Streptomyces violaceorubidus TaxID=284042 RepID=UPI0004C28E63|nr:hypothetical protein [Streptomyces violaceorubidus]